MMNHRTASAPDASAPCLRSEATCGAADHNGELSPHALGPLLTGEGGPMWVSHRFGCRGVGLVVHLCGYCELYTTRSWAMARLADEYLNCHAAPRYVAPARRRRAVAA